MIGGYLDGLFLKPEQQSQADPTIPLLPGSGEPNPQNPFATELTPQIELFSGTEKCPVGVPDLNYDSTDQNQNSHQCTVAPAQIIIPTDCTSPKNALVVQKLAAIDPPFKTSKSPRCPGENGVVFWLAYLTADQAAMLLAETDGAVEGITPDSPFKSVPLTPAPELIASQEVIPETTKIGSRLKKKRAILQVESIEWTRASDPSLTFLSTPPGRTNRNSRKYTYFKTAVDDARRQDIRVYLVDTGYAPGSGQIRGWSGSMEWAPREKKVKVMATFLYLVMELAWCPKSVAGVLGSFQGGLYLQLSKYSLPWPHLSTRWAPSWKMFFSENHSSWRVELCINTLLNSKVMIVAAAPFGKPGERIYTWPSSLARVTDMITIGAVIPVTKPAMPYRSRYHWSVAVDTVTVNAPGSGLFIRKDDTIRPLKGPSMAAAVVTVLIAYFLAIPDLQEYFQAQPDWALAVKDYLLAMSFP
ncbi:hypothetical protein MMC31_000547 [Peltigera leucophlebia]|nr:hypothetical protein [Peltigera leucophlebia]